MARQAPSTEGLDKQYRIYLVVFNCTPRRIDFRTSASEQIWPPRIVVGHQTFFLIGIDLVMLEGSASKRDARRPYLIEESYLLAPDVEEDEDESGEERKEA